jgi:hypothetical protein
MPGNEWVSKLEDVADQVSVENSSYHVHFAQFQRRISRSPHHQKNFTF